jgi:plastocyanin
MTRTNFGIVGIAAPVMIALMLLAGSFGIMANAQPSADAAGITIDNFAFGPQTLTVPVGATVTWTNSDDIPHTAVSIDGLFKSKVLDTDDKFSYTFTKPGTYAYYCTIHPKMTGTILVK